MKNINVSRETFNNQSHTLSYIGKAAYSYLYTAFPKLWKERKGSRKQILKFRNSSHKLRVSK